ncbi:MULTISPECIES: hypothetical protein [unclassified Streptomyces]|uniref:hypothetical protein n=1 Tax=unclassified Streptomyces TaxID=2593676 RepID=UPI0037F7322F
MCTLLLQMHLGPISKISQAALAPNWSDNALVAGLRTDLALKSGAALVVLVVATVLALYKTRGKTRYGQRKQFAGRKRMPDTETAVPLARTAR